MKCENCGEEPTVRSRGVTINRHAYLGSQIVQLQEQIPKLEKLARKTPPKTLIAEREKVKAAQFKLEAAKNQLEEILKERQALCELLGCDDDAHPSEKIK